MQFTFDNSRETLKIKLTNEIQKNPSEIKRRSFNG
jgi:hypothetical protein